jgi:hypothetical protein
MAENKTKPVGDQIEVETFLSKLTDASKFEDSKTLISLLSKITKCKPVRWGPSIIGFDSYEYNYESGHSGKSCVLGFSPRSTKFSIYLVDGFEDYQELLSKLGKYKTATACLYVNKLVDIDLKVLETILKKSFKKTKAQYK